MAGLRQQRRKAAARVARAQVVPAEFLDELGVGADDAIASLDPRFARGTPSGACWSAQKDASVSWSRYMIALLVLMNRRMVASTAQLARTNIRGTHARSLARYLRQMRTSIRTCRCINVQPGWLCRAGRRVAFDDATDILIIAWRLHPARGWARGTRAFSCPRVDRSGRVYLEGPAVIRLAGSAWPAGIAGGDPGRLASGPARLLAAVGRPSSG